MVNNKKLFNLRVSSFSKAEFAQYWCDIATRATPPRRRNCKRDSTLILEKKNIGGNTFLTQKIENYPGFSSISGPDLMERMAEQARGVGVEIKEGYEITNIERSGRTFTVDTPLGPFKSRALVAAVGSTYRRLDIPGASTPFRQHKRMARQFFGQESRQWLKSALAHDT